MRWTIGEHASSQYFRTSGSAGLTSTAHEPTAILRWPLATKQRQPDGLGKAFQCCSKIGHHHLGPPLSKPEVALHHVAEETAKHLVLMETLSCCRGAIT